MQPTPRRHTEVIETALATAGRRILEIGCGEGVLLAALRRKGADVLGLERDPGQLRRAAAQLGAGALLAGEGQTLPLADQSIDAVLYFNSFHHLPASLLREAEVEAARVLRPGGDLLVIEPRAEGPYFMLLQPLEDETAIRAAAERALDDARVLGFDPVARADYLSAVERASAEDALSALIAADPRRADAVPAVEATIRARFAALGEPTPRGHRRFLQPMRLHHFRRSADRTEVAVAYGLARDSCFALRREVFVVEQGVPLVDEFDAHERTAEHVLAREAGAVVGTLRWRWYDAATAKIERVAVRRASRGQGVGRRMLAWLLARLDGRGVEQTLLHAQLGARGLYGAFGFVAEGAPFMEDGIAHQRMRRRRPAEPAPSSQVSG